MDTFLQNKKALTKGGLVTIGLAFLLSEYDWFFTNATNDFRPADVFISILCIAICWLMISFLMHKLSSYIVLAGVGLIIIVQLAAGHIIVWDNPITLPVIIVFWLLVTYLVLPDFFMKYRIAIVVIYGLGIAFYLFFFQMGPNLPENYRLNVINSILLPIPVFAAFWLYEQWRWLKTLQADKARAELALLKSQINPHFFFNTLNNLYGLSVEKSEAAPAMILKLSDIMRYTIYDGRADLVPLHAEITYLQDYIDLHKIRYQKKVDIQFRHEVEKEIEIAPLLFIILLENAFKHGVESLTENAFIHLELKAKENQIIFKIKNNYETKLMDEKTGIGLENLKQRLKHIYPNQHKLTIEKTDTIYTAILFLDSPS